VAQGDPDTWEQPARSTRDAGSIQLCPKRRGDVAFAAQVIGRTSGHQGIWIGNSTSAPAKLMVNSDPTGTSLASFGNGVLLTV